MPVSILIVEDHKKVRQALRKLLEVRFSHYQVIEACSGEEAVTLTLEKNPQLIILMSKFHTRSQAKLTYQ